MQPEESRLGAAEPGKRPARRAWPWIAAALLALLAIALPPLALRILPVLTEGPAAARTTLPDGRLLRVEQVTYGKRHRYEAPLSLPDRFRRLLGWYTPDFSTNETTESDAAVLWMTVLSPAQPRSTLGLEGWTDLAAVDEHGCRFWATRRGTDALLGNGGSGSYANGRGETLPPVEDPLAFVVHSAELTAFPRRAGRFAVELLGTGGSRLGELTLSNPAPGAFPEWRPEPLPISRRAGDLEVTLTGLTLERHRYQAHGNPAERMLLHPTYRIRRNGGPAPGWHVEQTAVSDATGNRVTPDDCALCPREPAWKLSLTLRRTDEARFTPEESWTLPEVPVPGPREVRPFSGRRVIDGVTLEPLALAGPGRVRYRDRSVSALPIPEEALARLRDEDGMTSGSQSRQGIPEQEVSTGTPHLALRIGGLSGDRRLTVRAVDDRGRRHIARSRGTTDDVHFLRLKLPPDARRLRFTLAVHRPRTVEFTVRPPRPAGAGAGGAD